MALSLIPKRFMSSALQRICYNLSGFNKYGLWRDDLIDDTDQDVIEALTRIDEKTIDERNYRILRAVQLSIQKDVLPKDQWTKLENDKLYLTPVVKQVRKEREEREEWNKLY
ncbi:hypothetical protein WA026_019048 [Henosepilachna vigintioctopunctata]|uniref:Cytochrome b-c1 complex subunit 7 n=1 Tax=Henosepilachna vigintioctopunctata TaxID=420089 RepID=A0AAW1VIH7_9CUCU